MRRTPTIFGLALVLMCLHLAPKHANALLTFELDLNSLTKGQIVDDEFASNGITIVGQVSESNATPELVVIFDTHARNGTSPTDTNTPGDPDLQGPDSDNPGDTDWNWTSGNIAADTDLGNLIIIQENGGEDPTNPGFIDSEPDDQVGGLIRFESDRPVHEFRFDFVDLDEDPVEVKLRIRNEAGDQLGNEKTAADLAALAGIGDAELGNHSANLMPLVGADFFDTSGTFDSWEIEFVGTSGAIDAIFITVVPTPSAMSAGLVLLAALRARRRGCEMPACG